MTTTRHTHRTSGQVLTHDHPGGDRDHTYFQHHEDGVHVTCDHGGPGAPDDGDYHGELEAPGQEDWNTPDWAGKGFPSPLRKALRAELARRPGRMATLAELEIFHLDTERRVLIAELARMRDDGEVEFAGPRYRLVGTPPTGRCAEHSMDGPEHDACKR
jgi:hypothetical protein